MKYFTLEELLLLHFKIVEDYGGSHGVRDEGRLESAIAAPQQVVFGVELYSSVYEKAATYARAIVADHPLVDGNKRTAITSATIFLHRQGMVLKASPKELEDFAVKIAVEHLDVPMIAAWFKAHSKKAAQR
ncbi:MAG: type II toxin-antitoxin system death-on-curing family toxin [Candidatus Saccharibacteria bacterium]|nr:type II toxin-antitoxin system death-on-curing family toxin [Candidatus Saccharibacteria bacterium]